MNRSSGKFDKSMPIIYTNDANELQTEFCFIKSEICICHINCSLWKWNWHVELMMEWLPLYSFTFLLGSLWGVLNNSSVLCPIKSLGGLAHNTSQKGVLYHDL